jgi:hypothetical protein
MLVRDLDYVRPTLAPQLIQGAAYTAAKAYAKAYPTTAIAMANATAIGDFTNARTNTGVSFKSGEYFNITIAGASAYAIAQTGYRYSIAYDYDYDINVSRKY